VFPKMNLQLKEQRFVSIKGIQAESQQVLKHANGGRLQ
jgi:hypothetical protein